mgnify:CR=1 FL=1
MGTFNLKPYDWGDYLTVDDVARHFGQNPPYMDVEADLFKKFKIEFFYPHTKATVAFKAFITQYSESFNSDYQVVPVYGRMDPTTHFQSTGRIISLSWTAPAASEEESLLNLQNASKLAKMMYPVYGPGQGADQFYGAFQDATELRAPPRVVMRFSNLIKRGGLPGQEPSNLATAGLHGIITNYTWQPVFEDGFFDGLPPDGFSNNAALLPKTMALSLQYTVTHRDTNGWSDSGRWLGDEGFPWLPGSAPTPGSTIFNESPSADVICSGIEGIEDQTQANLEECSAEVIETGVDTRSKL